MAHFVVETLMSFLCRSGSINSCQSFVQNYPDLLEQLVYFFFLPTVLLIIFITVVVNMVLGRLTAPKYSLLLGVAVYIFIIISGWYPLFLWLSNLWYVLVIIIFGLIFLKKFILGSGGGSGKMPGHGGGGVLPLGSMATYAGKKMIKKHTGLEKKIDAGFKIAEQKVKRIESLANNPKAPHTDVELAISGYESTKAGLETSIQTLERNLGIAGERVCDPYWKKLSALDDRVEKAGGKEQQDYSEAA